MYLCIHMYLSYKEIAYFLKSLHPQIPLWDTRRTTRDGGDGGGREPRGMNQTTRRAFGPKSIAPLFFA